MRRFLRWRIGRMRGSLDFGDFCVRQSIARIGPEALALANQAEAIQPGTSWLRQQRADLALQTENWAEALDLIGPDARRPPT